MNQERQTQIKSQGIVQHEDEIELIDILRVIWKWKYFILVGTIACGIIAAIISFNMAKIYNIDMVLRPGILQVDERGRNVYIDSPENIAALIESGAFDKDIMNYLKASNSDEVFAKLNFKVDIPRRSDTIAIKYLTHDTKQGVDILNQLSQLLLQTYGKLVQHFKNEYDMNLSSLKSEVNSESRIIQSFKRNVKNIEKRIDELQSEVEIVKNDTEKLINERDKLLQQNPKDENILSSLLYRNTIQQNFELLTNYQSQLDDFRLRREEEQQKIEQAENKIDKMSSEIKNLQFKKDNIQNMQILQPPTATDHPIKPKITLNVILALTGGFFFFLFSSFFLEYLKRQKNA